MSIACPSPIDILKPWNQRTYYQSTVTSIVYEGHEQFPTGVFELAEPTAVDRMRALDWILLAQDVLPDATPLTAEERSSINEFFRSYFK